MSSSESRSSAGSGESATSTKRRPNCLHCKHYVVTWDSDQPRGCRAYEFKSTEMPSDVVRASSGEPCQLFEPKKPEPARPKLLR